LRADHVYRRWHRNLKAYAERDLAPAASRKEILVGGARLPSVAQFAELQFLRLYTFRKSVTPEARSAASRQCILGFKQGIRKEDRILPTDPDSPSAWLPVRNPFQMRAERSAYRTKDFINIR